VAAAKKKKLAEEKRLEKAAQKAERLIQKEARKQLQNEAREVKKRQRNQTQQSAMNTIAKTVEDRDMEEEEVETRISRSGRQIKAPRHLQQ
jgi:hypothetical protein